MCLPNRLFSIYFLLHFGPGSQVTGHDSGEQHLDWCKTPHSPSTSLSLGGLCLRAPGAGHHWEHGCCRGLLLGQPWRNNQVFFTCLCVSVSLDFLCAAVRGSRNGGEMTLDLDHMSRSVGWSPTLPPAGPQLCNLGLTNLPVHQNWCDYCLFHHRHFLFALLQNFSFSPT